MSLKPLKISLGLAALLSASTIAHAQRTAPVPNGTGYTFTSGAVSLSIAETKGARIRSLKHQGVELLYQNDSTGNPGGMGSTFWPAPQAHWTTTCRNANNNGCWPPATVFDGSGTGSAYTGGLRPDSSVSYGGAKDNNTGVRLRKTVWTNPDSSITIRYHIVNADTVKRAYAPWEVTRMVSGGLLFWAKSTEDTIRGNGAGGTAMMNMVTDTLGVKWHKYDSSATLSGTPKLWDGTSEGWFARVDKSRILYVKKFTDIPASKKAPVNENQIEIYSTTNRAYIEMELQGAFDTIAVGDSLAWDVKWYARKLPDSIPVTRNAALLAFVRQTVNGPVSIAPGRMRQAQGSLGLTNRRVHFELASATRVSLSLVNANGQVVQNLFSGQAGAGRHEFSMQEAPQGVYWLVLKGSGLQTQVRRAAFF